MGRDYIGERTIADPKLRAAEKVRKQAAAKKKRIREQQGMAAYLERAKWCKAKGCDNLATTGEDGWWPCCSEECFWKWHERLK